MNRITSQVEQMRSFKTILMTSLTLMILGMAGCGSPGDRVMKKQIDLMNQMSAACENDASDDVRNKLSKQMESNGQRFKELNLSEEQTRELVEKYKEPLEAAGKRMMKAMMKRTFDSMPGPGGGMPSFPFGQ